MADIVHTGYVTKEGISTLLAVMKSQVMNLELYKFAVGRSVDWANGVDYIDRVHPTWKEAITSLEYTGDILEIIKSNTNQSVTVVFEIPDNLNKVFLFDEVYVYGKNNINEEYKLIAIVKLAYETIYVPGEKKHFKLEINVGNTENANINVNISNLSVEEDIANLKTSFIYALSILLRGGRDVQKILGNNVKIEDLEKFRNDIREYIKNFFENNMIPSTLPSKMKEFYAENIVNTRQYFSILLPFRLETPITVDNTNIFVRRVVGVIRKWLDEELPAENNNLNNKSYVIFIGFDTSNNFCVVKYCIEDDKYELYKYPELSQYITNDNIDEVIVNIFAFL